MKVGILAGGLGSRLAEETVIKPKPMIEIGNRPIIWHIMKYYAHFQFTDFTIALGYKGEYIKRWLVDYAALTSDLTVSLRQSAVERHGGTSEDWRVNLVDTGQNTATGGRIRRLAPWLGDAGTFMLTWGDGVADIDLNALRDFHRSHGRIATLTAVRPPARFGHLELAGDQIVEFSEKPQAGEGWINGAFFVLEPQVFDYIAGDDTQFEKEPLERLAKDGQLMAYRHGGFWQCMDTVRDRKLLQSLWDGGCAPWKVWD
ncbi:Nucleoside-diphosphate-sugar pyrophosphorylase family protein [Frankia casuarinae]|jgi:glucose-1-phosphate cytidylyltransferase|uniref:Nucleotidyl transferase n=2 Tax=Frankia casuarinae (strain DSM 45818 / CECT 9043 / HFP020203 / CcI3) TaxID=106370 RepID=Q2JCQ3_FRACC|nr:MULTISPECIES: glucose-1-phosphate cytidylyltransferase [Frankia]ABD10939.1 Nucleotidyl transferase [Frankia casuarinae]ETA02208.1 Nucleoside-diphosphate-sugar pyrophosphorylase family protein [Frankia sp. CcI6]EYT92374.1 Nucleoside-diphosphate-sugar pyrophosphorylase family protein [Frankia casuarinae]KDA42891.1 Nucleoside-diphosphate-sugar pyrophosphorylase family protein [Frankia sp. BMG5.23]OAA28968.1 glucose-1-phosphate cytidylyltransferase [Frankia casuarinae]